MEENDYTHELLADEINAMMEVDVLCKLTDLSVQDEGEGEVEEDEAINSKRESVSFDEVNALAVQLKSLQLQASELGEDYHAVYSLLTMLQTHLVHLLQTTKY